MAKPWRAQSKSARSASPGAPSDNLRGSSPSGRAPSSTAFRLIWKIRSAISKGARRALRIARLQFVDSLGVMINDAAEARIAALRRHAGLEGRDILAVGVAPANPQGLRVAERTLPSRLLRAQQANVAVDALQRCFERLGEVLVAAISRRPQAIGEVLGADFGRIARGLRWAWRFAQRSPRKNKKDRRGNKRFHGSRLSGTGIRKVNNGITQRPVKLTRRSYGLMTLLSASPVPGGLSESHSSSDIESKDAPLRCGRRAERISDATCP